MGEHAGGGLEHPHPLEQHDHPAEHGRSESTALVRIPDKLRALAWYLIVSQEEEGRRVARELHDDISQKLAVLEIDVHRIEPQIELDPGEARRELMLLRTAIGRLSEEVRRISHALHPLVIDDLGLKSAIRSLVEDFRDREQRSVKFAFQELPDGIPVDIATGLYRIAQEALRNIARHAGMTHVRVILKAGSGRIRLQVSDAGVGFDPHASSLGLGLTGMEERARLMHGTLTIESKVGKGTRVTIDVPLPGAP